MIKFTFAINSDTLNLHLFPKFGREKTLLPLQMWLFCLPQDTKHKNSGKAKKCLLRKVDYFYRTQKQIPQKTCNQAIKDIDYK